MSHLVEETAGCAMSQVSQFFFFFDNCLVRCHNNDVSHFRSTMSHTSCTHFLVKLCHKRGLKFTHQT